MIKSKSKDDSHPVLEDVSEEFSKENPDWGVKVQKELRNTLKTDEQLKEEIFKEARKLENSQEFMKNHLFGISLIDLAISKAREGYISKEEHEKEKDNYNKKFTFFQDRMGESTEQLNQKSNIIKDLQETIKGMNRAYQEGYTEAISDLHRGFYEQWIEEEEGDFKVMAQNILKLSDKLKSLKSAIDTLKDKSFLIDISTSIYAPKKKVRVVLYSDLEALKNG